MDFSNSTWQKTKLIGRDKLLYEIHRIMNEPKKRFVLEGSIGVGLTALLEKVAELSNDNGNANVSFINGSTDYSTIMKTIAKDWNLTDINTKSKVSEIESRIDQHILQTNNNILFVDDIHKCSPKTLKYFSFLKNRVRICATIKKGIKKKDELKQFLWGCTIIKVGRLKNDYTVRLSEELGILFGCRLDYKKIAKHSNGLPGKIAAMASSNIIQRNNFRLNEEEINIAPFFVVFIAGIALFRILGRALGETDLTILGGLALIVTMIFRRIQTSK